MYLREAKNLKGVLLDIEGTTSPIEYVHQKLFSFAKENLESYLLVHWDDKQIKDILSKMKDDFVSSGGKPEDLLQNSEKGRKSLSEFIIKLINSDSKGTPLKELEALIWEDGYRDGRLAGEVFPDVPVALKRWTKKNLVVCIYSSGDIKSQRSIFSTTRYGDLTKYIFSYFDTKVGPKKESESYDRISGMLGLDPEQICFISDSYEELLASSEAGFVSIFSERGLPSPKDNSFPRINSFDEIPF